MDGADKAGGGGAARADGRNGRSNAEREEGTWFAGKETLSEICLFSFRLFASFPLLKLANAPREKKGRNRRRRVTFPPASFKAAPPN
jgi:hypothetical protein